MRGVKLSVERMVQQEIDSISTKVLMSHIEQLHDRMNYIVIHANKKAIFKLNNREDTFGVIKKYIAEYFGLPDSKIFLRNQKGEILLSKQKVIDELFPLQTAKIKGDDPVLYITFYKNLDTLEFVLGDKKE